jgi:carbamoyltransferase
VIPLEEAANWFELYGVDPSSPFMLRVMDFREARRDLVPAVVHVDGTGRVQTVTREVNGPYYELVRAFGDRTGVPVLLNTSLNVMGEPIVETPEDALWCLLLTQLDACIFDGAVVTKKAGYESLQDLYPFFAVGPGDIHRPPSGDGLLFAVTTPWGPYVFGLRDAQTLAALELLLGGLMDGNTRARTIFERLQKHHPDFTETYLNRLFAQLRRWRMISFRDAS